MNKKEFIKELSKKLNLSEDICTKINDVLEDNFIIGNKDKIIDELKEKINFEDETLEKIYETSMSILGSNIKEKLKNPFKSLD